jgi:hypothetical protein
MSGTDARLRELLDIAVGEPPGSISVPEVRRRARRRRTLHGITAAAAAAACCAAVSVLALGLAAPLFGHSSSPRRGSHGGAVSVPRYYLQEQDSRDQRALVRTTATGAVTATVRCPWAGAAISGIAPTGDDAFFMTCERASGSLDHIPVVTGSRLYRFRLTSAGRVARYSAVPGGALPGLATFGLTAAADGSEVAMNTSTGRPPRTSTGVLVINTTTGAHAVWRGTGGRPSDALYQDFTLSPNGRDLRFLTTGSLLIGSGHPEEWQVSPASRGGLLSSARVLVRVPSRKSVPMLIVYAQVNPGGSVLTLVAVQLPVRPRTTTVVVEQISVASDRVIRDLFRAGARGGFNAIGASSDPTGRYIILDYSPQHGVSNGWLEHGHLVALTPARGTIPAYETW